MSKVSNPEDRVFYVYVLFRPWNGSPCYIGKGKGKRWRRHGEYAEKHKNSHLANIFKKSGCNLPVVKIRERLTEQEAFEIECAIIAALGRQRNGGPLVNLTDGGDGPCGFTHSDETKVITGQQSKNVWSDPMMKARIIARQNEGRASAEYRAKRSEISKAIWADPEKSAALREKRRNRFSDPAERVKISIATKLAMASPEVMASVSAAQKKRYTKQDERERLAAFNIGRIHTPETRSKRSKSVREALASRRLSKVHHSS